MRSTGSRYRVLTDEQWERIEPLLASNSGRRGQPSASIGGSWRASPTGSGPGSRGVISLAITYRAEVTPLQHPHLGSATGRCTLIEIDG